MPFGHRGRQGASILDPPLVRPPVPDVVSAADAIRIRGARVHKPAGRRRRHPAEPAGRHHRRQRQRQELARIRHAAGRGPASVRRLAQRLLAAVLPATGEAGRRPHRRAPTRRRDRPEPRLTQPAEHGRHDHRRVRLICGSSTPALAACRVRRVRNEPISQQSPAEIEQAIGTRCRSESRVMILAPLVRGRKGQARRGRSNQARKAGFVRAPDRRTDLSDRRRCPSSRPSKVAPRRGGHRPCRACARALRSPARGVGAAGAEARRGGRSRSCTKRPRQKAAAGANRSAANGNGGPAAYNAEQRLGPSGSSTRATPAPTCKSQRRGDRAADLQLQQPLRRLPRVRRPWIQSKAFDPELGAAGPIAVDRRRRRGALAWERRPRPPRSSGGRSSSGVTPGVPDVDVQDGPLDSRGRVEPLCSSC